MNYLKKMYFFEFSIDFKKKLNYNRVRKKENEWGKIKFYIESLIT